MREGGNEGEDVRLGRAKDGKYGLILHTDSELTLFLVTSGYFAFFTLRHFTPPLSLDIRLIIIVSVNFDL